MATSGTISGHGVTTWDSGSNYAISARITWKRNSYSIEKNTSSVTFTLAFKKNDSATTYGTGSWKLTINGKSYTSSSYAEIKSSSWKDVFSKTVTITHDSDGTKSFSVNASGSYIPGTSFTNTSCSDTITLDTIPRASTFNSVTSSVALGGTATIKITAKSSSFYHKATWTCGSASATQNLGKIDTTSQKSYTYTIPTGWSAQMPNATSKTASVKIQTYSDSGYKTAIGSAVTKNFTVTVPNNSTYNPTVSLSTTLGNATGLGSSIYVQGKTKVTLSATGSSKAHATIKSYVFKRASTTLKTVTSSSTSASTSETTNTTGSVTYSVTITDSRGRTATASKTITVNAYSNPKLTVNDCYRANSSGTKDTTGGTYAYVKATFSSTTAGGNSITSSTVKYKPASGGDWTGNTNLTSGTGVTLGGGNLVTNTAYVVRVSITDKVGTTVTKDMTIPTIFVTMDFKAGGTGVAIGKIAETDNLFDVKMNMQLNSQTGAGAWLKMLASGHRDRGLVYSDSGNLGFFEVNDSNVYEWLLRIDPSKNVFFPGDRITIGESSDEAEKYIYLENSNRKVSFAMSGSGTAGFHQPGVGWIISADNNNNVTVPNGTFSAPKSIVHGSISITPSAANTPTAKAVTWSKMGGTPHVAVTPITAAPGTKVLGVGVGSVTTTGCTIYVTREDTSQFSVYYIAIC